MDEETVRRIVRSEIARVLGMLEERLFVSSNGADEDRAVTERQLRYDILADVRAELEGR